MVCAPVRSIIPSLKLGDYLSIQAHKPCSISHLETLSKSYRLIVTVYKFDNINTFTMPDGAISEYLPCTVLLLNRKLTEQMNILYNNAYCD